MYKIAHEIALAKGIGWHIWHNNSFSPFYRAEHDYTDYGQYADFLKVVMYNLCGGERLAHTYAEFELVAVFADLSPEATLALTYDVQQFHDRPLSDLGRRTACRPVR